MPSALAEAARPSASSRTSQSKSNSENHKDTAAASALQKLERHILMDGFKIVFDLERSRGSYMYDAATGHRLIDFYGFFGSVPVGFNHPHFDRPEVKEELLRAAKTKIANSDVYSEQYAEFVETFTRVAGLPPLERYLFIEGGALAIENCLKAAMDWKVRKNMAGGRGHARNAAHSVAGGERGTEILHFRSAFHGRSGYTMSLTNTDPRKVELFAKFNWPRVSTPFINFALEGEAREQDVIAREKKSEEEIRKFIAERGVDIAAIIIEPIQGEGGDNHFRGEWLQTLRRICDENEMLLIFDEVQTGLGTTGKVWASQHFGVKPDLMAFGKKVQVCGVMAGPRLDEVEDNAFRLPSRLNSTWGGNFTDMVRSKHYLRIIEEENLVENARVIGERIVAALREISSEHLMISAVRGRGLFIAFDLPNPETRDKLWKGLYEAGVLVLKSGERAIRFRPALDITAEAADEAMAVLREQCGKLGS
ncbi:MAG: L-lysine 6-transaminase [Chthoniobacterales bacterium]|nr:L-lysine 6-transaminase [Chthoniobacterales bacterium]